ncbi:UNVERIFIED_CONTAM: protein root UVB sensitive 2, chloroplastic [Sesamum calycinum]|uniref:Protein root UVB sensitive 2, chloroplastic n=1 Tax=Sesamum calycinum TaxID=2727403 RepID=A0AAW2RTW9_9LAMI
MLAALLCKRAKLHEELRNIEKQVYDMETSYLQDPSQCGNVLKGFEGFLSSSKSTTLQACLLFSSCLTLHLKHWRGLLGCCNVDVEMDASSVFHFYAFRLKKLQEMVAYQQMDHDPSEFGIILQWEPKKGRGPREAKRRQSSEADFDYEDDPDLIHAPITCEKASLANSNRILVRGEREILKMLQKKSNDPPQAPAPPPVPVYWVETSDSVSHHFQFEPDGQLSSALVSSTDDRGCVSVIVLGPVRFSHFYFFACSGLRTVTARAQADAAGLGVLGGSIDEFGYRVRYVWSCLEVREGGCCFVYSGASRVSVLLTLCSWGLGSAGREDGCVVAGRRQVHRIAPWIEAFGIFLASTVLVVGPLLSLFHIYCVTEEMRATPVNTLNPQRTAMIVADFYKDMILERNATGEDALKGWLVAAYAAEIEKTLHQTSSDPLEEAYERTVNVFSPFLSELQAKGWHTDRFLDGTGRRFAL